MGIIIALPEEFDELSCQISEMGISWQSQPDPETGGHYYLFDYPIPNSSDYYRCVTTFAGEMGPTATSLATTRLIDKWKPKTVILPGIGAGIHSDVMIGDVVVADQVDGYEEDSKAVEGEEQYPFELRGKWHRCDSYLINEAKHLKYSYPQIYQDWNISCSKRLEKLLSSENIQELINQQGIREQARQIPGDVASGVKVGASQKFTDWLKEIDRKFLVLEMESYGFMYASKNKAKPEKTLILRGISDYGDERKKQFDKIGDGALRRYAMHNALQLLWCFLKIDVLPRRKRYQSRDKFLEKDVEEVAESLEKGKLVLFIGPGINLSDTDLQGKSRLDLAEESSDMNSDNKVKWDELPPSEIEIANCLARDYTYQSKDLIGFPCDVCPFKLNERPESPHCLVKQEINKAKTTQLAHELAREQELAIAKVDIRCWAQYWIDKAPTELVHQLSELFRPEENDYKPYCPNQVQEFLANLPLIMNKRRYPYPYQLLVTTNYDKGLELAFDAKGQNFDVVSYIAEGEEQGKFKHKSYGNCETPPEVFKEANKQDKKLPLGEKLPPPDEISKVDHPLILKLYGGVLFKVDKKQDSFVIAPIHHMNYLRSKDNKKLKPSDVLPPKLIERLDKSDILFVGYSTNDADLHFILSCFWSDSDREKILSQSSTSEEDYRPRGWLIHQSKPGKLDRRFWKKWNVKLVSCSLKDFVTQLEKYINRN
ncbi:MAG: SIR2 family protein [Calothrix sp. MO_167.B12]|nr:SIR2 family protein [Calothrix sp. MO_167.B12]